MCGARGPEEQLAADNERLRRQLAALTEAKAAAINDDNVRLLAALEQARAARPPPIAAPPHPRRRRAQRLRAVRQDNAELEAESRRLVARLAGAGGAAPDAARDGLLAANERLTAAKQRVRGSPAPTSDVSV